jgi:D-aminoacyl-tRNA deacylase
MGQKIVRVLIQRVNQATVSVNDTTVSNIGKGLLVFVGIEDVDEQEDIIWLANKICNLRIFDDANKVPNLSLIEAKGEILVVSQFTLHAATKKGNRPSYIKAAKPNFALPMYEKFVGEMKSILKTKVATGVFGADMQVSLVNDGPITIWIDSKNKE